MSHYETILSFFSTWQSGSVYSEQTAGYAVDQPCKELWQEPLEPSVLHSESLHSLPPPSCRLWAKPKDTF